MKKPQIDQAFLKSVLHYDPETGLFTDLASGVVRGTKSKVGYIIIQLKKKKYYAHRLAFLYMEGVFPERSTDHIDRCKHNNRWVNLRKCAQSQNQANQGLRITNTSGRKGVIYQKNSGRWRAQITYQGQQIYLGSYPDKDEAATVYQRAADGLFPGFALKMVYGENA